MRIAFIADVHANLPALEAVIADAREHGATHLLCLGDIVGYGPQPAKTLERIREVASGIVLGNHDAAAAELIDLQYFNPFAKETAERAILALDDEAKAFLRTLPNLLEVKNIACSHSCFDAPETYRYLETEEDAARSLEAMPKFTLLIIGHTHVPCLFEQETPGGLVRKLPVADVQMRPGCRYVVNPGSVGFPRTDTLTADYLIYDTLMRRLTFRSLYYDLTPYRLALVRNGYNPLNYWFLTPSARRRQSELAMRNPVAPKPSAANAHSPFQPVKQHRSSRFIFWIFAAVFVIVLLLFAILQARLGSTLPESAPTAYYNPANLLAPLQQWKIPEGAQLTLDSSKNQLELLPDGLHPRHITLLSPLTPIPDNCKRLQFSFKTTAPIKGKEKFSVYAEFFDAKGNRRRDHVHNYKRIGPQSFSIRVPERSEALQIQFNFDVKHPLKLQNPELERKVE